jgi:uncharacterized membrane protein
MKRSTYFLIIALVISLFIYLFYRTDRTVINSIINVLFGAENYQALKTTIRSSLPLPEFVIYSLPEGLWVFCITLTSKDLYLRINKTEIHFAILPLIFVISLEILQFFNITNGTFDFVDIFTAIQFWMIGYFIIEEENEKHYPLKKINKRSVMCLMSYLIVYLAHVSR